MTDLGKKKSTMQSGKLTIKFFEKGVIVRMRGGEPITLEQGYASTLACCIKEYSNPRLFTEVEAKVLLKIALEEGMKDFWEVVRKYDAMSMGELSKYY